jgi:hypothetical protein
VSIGWYAPVVILLALGLWFGGSVRGSVIALMFLTLFGGGAAFNVAGASIQPSYFFLIFLVAQVLLTMFNRSDHVNVALRTNIYLAFFAVYGAITAFMLPKIFARAMQIPPMLINKADIFYTAPLGPSKQNITTAVYLLATLLISICAGAATSDPKSRRSVVNWSVAISWIHIGFGIVGLLATRFGGGALIAFFRNAKYAELTEESQGYIRIAGIFPEPSAYGGYGFIWFVLMTELWLRGVKPKWTGPAAGALFLIIVACTSTSCYFALAVYGAVLLARWMFAPGRFPVGKATIVGMGALTMFCAGLAAAAFLPEVAHFVGRVLSSLTVHKLESRSGTQRAFWAQAGVTAFVRSYGLGIGAGSFRCSSLPLAILGSTGIVGFAAFSGHILKLIRPFSSKTYRFDLPANDAVAVSAAWAACAGLLPALVSSPSPDPPILFSLLGGLALGWNYAAERGRKTVGAPVPPAPAARPAGLALT